MNPLASFAPLPPQEGEEDQLRRLLLMGLDPRASAVEAQGHQEALQRQAAFGNLALLTGDSVLAPFGRQQLGEVARMEPLSARNATLAQGAQRLALQQAEEARKYQLAQKKLGLDEGFRERELKLKEKTANAAAARAAAGGGGASDGKQLTAGVPAQIADLDSAITMMEELKSNHGRLKTKGALGRLGAVINPVTGQPWSADVADFEATRRPIVQMVGKGMEGGILRPEDEKKYDRMTPGAGDDDKIGPTKADAVIRMLRIKRQSLLDAESAAGYNTKGFAASPAPAVGARSSRQPDVDLATPPKKTAASILLERSTRSLPAAPPAAAPEPSDPTRSTRDMTREERAEAAQPSYIRRSGEALENAYLRNNAGDLPDFSKLVTLPVPRNPPKGYVSANIKDGETVRVQYAEGAQAIFQKRGGKLYPIVLPKGFQ